MLNKVLEQLGYAGRWNPPAGVHIGNIRWRATYDYDAAAVADHDLTISTQLVDAEVAARFKIGTSQADNTVWLKLFGCTAEFLTDTMQYHDDIADIENVWRGTRLAYQATADGAEYVKEIYPACGFTGNGQTGIDSDLATLRRAYNKIATYQPFEWPLIVKLSTCRKLALRFTSTAALIGADAVVDLIGRGVMVTDDIAKAAGWVESFSGQGGACGLNGADPVEAAKTLVRGGLLRQK